MGALATKAHPKRHLLSIGVADFQRDLLPFLASTDGKLLEKIEGQAILPAGDTVFWSIGLVVEDPTFKH